MHVKTKLSALAKNVHEEDVLQRNATFLVTVAISDVSNEITFSSPPDGV